MFMDKKKGEEAGKTGEGRYVIHEPKVTPIMWTKRLLHFPVTADGSINEFFVNITCRHRFSPISVEFIVIHMEL